MFDQNFLELSGILPLYGGLPLPGENHTATPPVNPLQNQTEFRAALKEIENHHRAVGGLIEGSAETAKMFHYTGLLVRLQKLTAKEGGDDIAVLRTEILETIKELTTATRELERDLYKRLGPAVSARIPTLDARNALAVVTAWGVVRAETPTPLPTGPAQGTPSLLSPAPTGSTLTVPALTAVTSTDEFSVYRRQLEEVRLAFSRAVTPEHGKTEFASFEAALKRLDTLAGLASIGSGNQEQLDAVFAAMELVQQTGTACRETLQASANRGNPFQARLHISRNKDQVVTFQVPVERANDVVFDFQGDQILTLIKDSGNFPPLVYKFRQFETSMQGPGSTFKATRTLDPTGRFYTFQVTMDFYADYLKAKLIISAPNPLGTGADTLVFSRRDGIRVPAPVAVTLPTMNSQYLAAARLALSPATRSGENSADSGGTTPLKSAPPAFLVLASGGSTVLSVDSRIASSETLAVFQRAKDAGYEIEAVGRSSFRIFRNMNTFDGKPVRVRVGDDIFVNPGTPQQVAIGDGRVVSDAPAVQAALIARDLRAHLDCPPVLIERSSVPIDCSTSPELALLLRSRPDLRVRYSGHQKFGSANIISYEVVKKNGRGGEEVYTSVSLSSYSDDWGRERDTLILAAIQEKDKHNASLACIRIDGPAAPGGLPIYQQLSPKTFRLLSLLEQQGRVVTCTKIDETWVTFTITDRATKKEIGSVNLGITRFSDAVMRDQATTKMVESLLRFVDRSTSPEENERQSEIAARLRSRENRSDYILTIVDAASKLDEISLLQGMERWHALALAKHLSRLPTAMSGLTKGELEDIATPLLHTLQRMERYEPGYLNRICADSPDALNAFVISLAKRIRQERASITDNVVMDKDTQIVSLFHTDKMFGPEGILNLALRVGIPVDTVMSLRNPSFIQGGKAPNLEFLSRLERLSADPDSRVLFFVSAHGVPYTIQTSDKPSENIQAKEIAARLLKAQLAEVKAGRRTTIDLSRKTLFLNTCYSYDIAQMVFRELHLQTEGLTLIPPTIVTTAQRGMLSWGNRETTATPMMDELLKNIPSGTKAVTIGHLLSADATNAARFDRMLKNNAYLTYRPLGIQLLFYTEDHAVFHQTKPLGALLDELERDTRRLVPDFKAPKRGGRAGPSIPNELSFNQISPDLRTRASTA